ncbi:MAG: hypothetical protein H7Y60_15295 [Rhodospirillaceae bacterium]|nr:hypothetical protein [Rhodospirillales bacterium]
MRRLALFVIVTALLVAAAVWLADRPGQVVIHWQGWRLDTTVPVLVLALASLALKLVRAIIGFPRHVLANRQARRTRDGYRALSDGLAAIASGDPRRARKLARRADKLLEDRSLTGLLTAQAAELSGDESDAERRFTTMVERPETAFLGLKGLLALAQKRGEQGAALDYAHRAWALGGPTDGIAATLFDLQARAGQWPEAEATLMEAKKRGAMSNGDVLHARALVLLERSRVTADPAEAVKLTLSAHKADSGFVPAATQTAALFHRLGKPRKAESVIATTWRINPHPDLVEASMALAPAETPLQRVKRVEKLVRANPDSPDGHMALAEAALAAKLWGQARTHLQAALAERPTGGLYVLLAKLEREETQDEAAAQAWLAKSTTAPAEPAWVCTKCNKSADSWSVTCPHCGTVDGLVWK